MLELKAGWLHRQLEIVDRNVNAWGVVKQLRLQQALVNDSDPVITKFDLQNKAIQIMRHALDEWEQRIRKELREAQKDCKHEIADALPGAGGFGWNECIKCGLTDL